MLKSFRLVASVMTLIVASMFAAAGTASATQVIPGFETFCFYNHMAQDDPIVDPGMPGGAMHMHDFAGNMATTATSTAAQLQASKTNCQLASDTAAYWAPVLYSHGKVVHSDRLHAYYRAGNLNLIKTIRPVPAGLKMIAGNPMSTGPQLTTVIGWNCGVQGQTQYNHPISCKVDQKIVMHVFFPNCWDGVHLDSPDHKSHMAYSYNGACPASHPVAIPRVTEDYGYPLLDGTGITLSSGSYLTAHADFWNTWNQAAMNQLTHDCINAGRQCGPQQS